MPGGGFSIWIGVFHEAGEIHVLATSAAVAPSEARFAAGTTSSLVGYLAVHGRWPNLLGCHPIPLFSGTRVLSFE